MASSSLSAAGSDIFKERLADLRRKNSWSYTAVAGVLGCSRKTAINLLKEGNQTSVKAAYASRLERHIDGEIPWSAAAINASSIRNILTAWAAAEEKYERRKLAYRLAGFVSEYAVYAFGMCATTAVEISALANPVSVLLTVKNKFSNQVADLLFVFDIRDRSSIPMMLFQDGARTYKGHLTITNLKSLLNRLRKCQAN